MRGKAGNENRIGSTKRCTQTQGLKLREMTGQERERGPRWRGEVGRGAPHFFYFTPPLACCFSCHEDGLMSCKSADCWDNFAGHGHLCSR